MLKASRVALLAALTSFGPALPQFAMAQDVTLISREGSISLSGTLQGYDGEFYRIDSEYGPLTIDGAGVICEGPACPDLIAPKAMIRLVGLGEAGEKLLPGLFAAFAANRGLSFAQEMKDGLWSATITEPKDNKRLAEISFRPLATEAALAALADDEADLMLSFNASENARALALETLVALKSPANPTPQVSSLGLAEALAAKADNWSDLGGPDMPVVLHGLEENNDFAQALERRIGQKIVAQERHESLGALAQAVAKDPWGLSLTAASRAKEGAALKLIDSCGFPMLPDSLSVKAEDYPLAILLYLNLAPRRLPLMAREFLDFLGTAAADRAIAQAGYIGRAVERAPMTGDGLRLLNAIKGAGEDVPLAELQRLAQLMEGADRLSLTFRFDESGALNASSREALARLAQLIGAKQFPLEKLYLVGFTDRAGKAQDNLDLGLARAETVRRELAALSPELKESELPEVVSFGEALPMACDDTRLGRFLNRRVELWLRPDFSPEGPAHDQM